MLKRKGDEEKYRKEKKTRRSRRLASQVDFVVPKAGKRSEVSGDSSGGKSQRSKSDVLMSSETEKVMWDLIKTCLQSRSITQNKLDSYNELITTGLKMITQLASPFMVKYEKEWHIFSFVTFSMSKPILQEYDRSVHEVSHQECRLRNESYKSPCYTHVLWKIYFLDEEFKTPSSVPVRVIEQKGRQIHSQLLPYISPFSYHIMVKSKVCHLGETSQGESDCVHDCGSYFVVNGKEKVLMYRERTVHNQVLAFAPKDMSAFKAQVRSEHAGKFRSTSTLYMHLLTVGKQKQQKLMMVLPFSEQLPFVVIMRALGVITDKQIMIMMKAIAGRRWRPFYQGVIHNALNDHRQIWTQRAAILCIGKAYKEKTIEGQMRVGLKNLHRELLPHMGSKEADYRNKAYYLCYMVCRFLDKIEAYTLTKDPLVFDNKDLQFTKRTETPYELLGGLTRQYFMLHYIPSVKKAILQQLEKKQTLDIYQCFDNNSVTKGIGDALATGRWHANKGKKATQTGVSQDIERLNFLGTQDQHTKIINHLGKEGHHVAPRLLQNPAWGFICPYNSPEGIDCGLIKNLTPMCKLSSESDPRIIADLIASRVSIKKIDTLAPEILHGMSDSGLLFVYGRLIGTFRSGEEVVDCVRKMRRQLEISTDIGVSTERWNNQIISVHVRTDRGRNLRPVIILETWQKLTEAQRGQLYKCTLMDLFQLQLLEYVDALEQTELCIATHVEAVEALDPRYTHSELHGTMMLGYSAMTIPFSCHNQAPRVTYQCAMGKQAKGAHSTNMLDRMDTTAYALWYPERPLVGTKLRELLGMVKLPAGVNPRMAVKATKGWNQEDAFCIDQSCIDMGMFRSWVFGTITVREHDHGGQKERFGLYDPEITVGRRKGDYKHLDQDGLIKVGVRADSATVLVSRGRILEEHWDKPTKVRDTSVMMKTTEHGIIDKVMLTTEVDGLKTVKIRYRKICIPERGDKFASLAAQKGTIGRVIPHEDMPFQGNGEPVNILVNGLGFTSRMTFGQLLEALLGTICSMIAKTGDGTPYSRNYRDFLYQTKEMRAQYFREGTIHEELMDAMRALGLHPNAEVKLYSGTTGELMKDAVLVGPVYYQKLKHMVADKIRARARGRTSFQTRQPTEGRTRDGGMRFGEMERDAVGSHGAAAFAQDRLAYCSDPYYIHVCRICHQKSIHTSTTDRAFCNTCKKYDTSYQIFIPYRAKNWMDDVRAVGLNLRIKPKAKAIVS